MLGFIPDFQYSADPRVNPYVNPTVSMPPGMFQAGVYYTQPAYSMVAPEVIDPDPISWSVPQVRVPTMGPTAPSAGPIAGALGYVMAWPNPGIANVAYGATKNAQLMGSTLGGAFSWMRENKFETFAGAAAAVATWLYLAKRDEQRPWALPRNRYKLPFEVSEQTASGKHRVHRFANKKAARRAAATMRKTGSSFVHIRER